MRHVALALVFGTLIGAGACLVAEPLPAQPAELSGYELVKQFGAGVNENRPPVLRASYADVLEGPLRAVVRIESLQAPGPDGQAVLSSGSGVILNADDGFVVTNAHVVGDGLAIRVQLADGRWRNAVSVGQDIVTDLAILRVEASDIRQIEMADSDAIRVGDLVFAAGYPLGLEQTLSMGIVSGLGRSGGGSRLFDYIQTDAAINSGNSGGPLFDSQGRLAGINTAILSQSGGSIGIGFAIPSRMVADVTAQLIEFGEVRRGQIGLVLGPVKEADSDAAGLRDWDGALVVSVDPHKPAGLAGMQVGDVIRSYNGRRVRSPEELRSWIGVSRVGSPLVIGLWRDGAPKEVTLVAVPFDRPGPESLGALGATVRQLLLSDSLPEDLTGVVIERVAPGSPAEVAGLQPGDVILSINDELVSSPQVCDRLVGESDGRVRVIVYRAGMVRPFLLEDSRP